jgi:hypothetical protein
MNANGNSARPVRIRIDDVQVNSGDGAEGKDVYQLAALGEDYALFRKVDRTDARLGTEVVVQPTA